MDTIKYKRFGGPIKFRFVVKTGKLGVNYNFELCKRKCRTPMLIYSGNNYQDSFDDFHYLPSPICDNNNRILKLIAEYTAFISEKGKEYLLSFEMYQAKELIKQFEKKGYFSNHDQVIEMDYELIMEE